MSGKVMGLVLRWYDGARGELLTAVALGDNASDDGENVRPSVVDVAARTRQCARSVQRHLRRMERTGFLILVGNAGGGRGLTRRYCISPYWLASAAEREASRLRERAEHFRRRPGNGDWHAALRGNPPIERATRMSQKDDTVHRKDDTIVSPEPSIEPSVEPSKDIGALNATPAEPVTENRSQPRGDTPRRRRQLPDDFVPNAAHLRLAAELGVSLDAELANFRDYHLARGSTMRDWDAALRTWLRNAVKFARRGGKSSAKPAESTREWARRLAREHTAMGIGFAGLPA